MAALGRACYLYRTPKPVYIFDSHKVVSTLSKAVFQQGHFRNSIRHIAGTEQLWGGILSRLPPLRPPMQSQSGHHLQRYLPMKVRSVKTFFFPLSGRHSRHSTPVCACVRGSSPGFASSFSTGNGSVVHRGDLAVCRLWLLGGGCGSRRSISSCASWLVPAVGQTDTGPRTPRHAG